MAQERVAFQGLPSRTCWLGYGERDVAGLEFNRMVRDGELSAPIVLGHDYLDCGSVASPNREAEAMKEGTDAVGRSSTPALASSCDCRRAPQSSLKPII